VSVEELLAQRIRIGAEYLAALANPIATEWQSGYEKYLSGTLSLPETLTLLHGQWWSHGAHHRIQGRRRYTEAASRTADRCRADLIWGYQCGLRTEGHPEYDHVFPYSLGGPTIAANRIPLCRIHNAVKGADVHLFPWEAGEPAWVADQLKRITALMLA
jgi:hypothetical protein